MLETNGKDSTALALHALGWILADDKRAERMLSLTGLTPARLREAVSEPALQAAILRFLESYEPDLVACAEDLAVRPEALVAARRELEA
jgi:hypothetical protein